MVVGEWAESTKERCFYILLPISVIRRVGVLENFDGGRSTRLFVEVSSNRLPNCQELLWFFGRAIAAENVSLPEFHRLKTRR